MPPLGARFRRFVRDIMMRDYDTIAAFRMMAQKLQGLIFFR